MQIYLPIAEMSANVFLLLGLGGAVGFLSGMFGVGGGFLMTPLLIFIGVPPAVAVGTEANQIVAASVSGALAQWRRRNVDLKMGMVLLAGGIVGSTIGVWLFKLLRGLGQIELVISLSFVVFLGTIGALMLVESVGALVRKIGDGNGPTAMGVPKWRAARARYKDKSGADSVDSFPKFLLVHPYRAAHKQPMGHAQMRSRRRPPA